MSNPGQDFGVVALYLHPAAATVTKLPPPQFIVDQFRIDGHSRGQSLNNRDQRPSM
jgi:hypothetical protein